MLLQMIKSKVGNIKSGWRSVFMIFTAAADDDLESIVESAFENVEQGKKLPFFFFQLMLLFFFPINLIAGSLQLYWNTLIKLLEIVLWTASTVLLGLPTIKLLTA